MVEVIQEETFTKKNGDAKIQSEEAPKPKLQKVVNTKFEFKNQEIEDKFFLIFNVSEYVKENCEVGFTDNEVSGSSILRSILAVCNYIILVFIQSYDAQN